MKMMVTTTEPAQYKAERALLRTRGFRLDDEDSRRGCGGNYFGNETWGLLLGAKPPLFEPADSLSVWTKGQFIPLKQNRNT